MVAIHLLLHDRAGTLASLLYKAEKPFLRPSVRSFLVEWISVVGARIGVKLTRKEAPVLWADEVYF